MIGGFTEASYFLFLLSRVTAGSERTPVEFLRVCPEGSRARAFGRRIQVLGRAGRVPDSGESSMDVARTQTSP